MVFSSITFLYWFLPIFLIIYFILPSKYRNYCLLFFSLIFYFYGEGAYLLILIASCLINFFLAKLMTNNHAKLLLILGIILNVLPLFYFKYMNFFLDNINIILKSNLHVYNIVMPIGISFFTFQNISYLIDVYRKSISSEKNIFTYATYITMFPQLIAGPIVRYSDIKNNLNNRKTNYKNIYAGFERFVIGLAKKILLANAIGELISILNPIDTKTVIMYWLIAFAYVFQIYFDFSGYSDMAIGLGKMLNFDFLENFNYPLIAKSITDFWRRWHMSLSQWFRDYIYIPLGGNRCRKLKQYFNIMIVWLLTGFWHGANWNFIIWGVYFGIILIIEKTFLLNYLKKHSIISHIYTLFFVTISFLIFSLDNMSEVLIFLRSMFGFNNINFIDSTTSYYLFSYLGLFIVLIVGSTPLAKNIYSKIKEKKIIKAIEPIITIILLFIVTAYIVDSSFNPFLYFRF